MRPLNNRGITTIEVLLCFILVVIITTSMYGTVSSFNNKRLVEQYKEKIFSYKELLTKEIQDDFVQIGLTHAKYTKNVVTEDRDDGIKEGTVIHTVDCTLQDGTTRQLIIYQALAKDASRMGTNTAPNDYFMIEYGPNSNLTQYPIPDLGETTNDDGATIKFLIINNISIKIEDDKVLSIYIGFYHPELTTRYGINIVAPIGYMSDVVDGRDTTTLFG